MKDFLAGAFFGVVVFMVFTTLFNSNPSQIRRQWQQKAIDHGAAEWVLIGDPGPNAKFEFKWLEKE